MTRTAAYLPKGVQVPDDCYLTQLAVVTFVLIQYSRTLELYTTALILGMVSCTHGVALFPL